MLKRLLLISLLSAWVGTTFAAQSGTISKTTDLKTEPSAQATNIRSLSAGDAITIMKRQGGWYQITAGSDSGWVDMLSIQMSSAGGTAKSGDTGLGNLMGIVTGTSTDTTVATGVRGIDEVDLQNAQPDAAALARMESASVSSSDARQFAQQGGLSAHSYSYAQ